MAWRIFFKLVSLCSQHKILLVLLYAFLLGDWYSVIALAEEEWSTRSRISKEKTVALTIEEWNSSKENKTPAFFEYYLDRILTKENLIFAAIWGGAMIVILVFFWLFPPDGGDGGASVSDDWFRASTEHFLAGGDLKGYGREATSMPDYISDEAGWTTELDYPLPGDIPLPKETMLSESVPSTKHSD